MSQATSNHADATGARSSEAPIRSAPSPTSPARFTARGMTTTRTSRVVSPVPTVPTPDGAGADIASPVSGASSKVKLGGRVSARSGSQPAARSIGNESQGMG